LALHVVPEMRNSVRSLVMLAVQVLPNTESLKL
jgi:hypothetical protein